MLITSNTSVEIPTRPGRSYQISGLGTYGGATVTLQTFQDGAWRDVPSAAWGGSFAQVWTNGGGTSARLAVSSSSGTTSISCCLAETPE